MVKENRKKKSEKKLKQKDKRPGKKQKQKDNLLRKAKQIAQELIKANSISPAVMAAATKAGENRLSQEATQATPTAQQVAQYYQQHYGRVQYRFLIRQSAV